jgi:hypothetical protein
MGRTNRSCTDFRSSNSKDKDTQVTQRLFVPFGQDEGEYVRLDLACTGD